MAVYFTGMGSGLITSVKVYGVPKYPPVDTNWMTAPSTPYATYAFPFGANAISLSTDGRTILARNSYRVDEYRLTTAFEFVSTLISNTSLMQNYEGREGLALSGDGNIAFLGSALAQHNNSNGRVYVGTRVNASSPRGALVHTYTGGTDARFGGTLDVSLNGLVRVVGSPYMFNGATPGVGKFDVFSLEAGIPNLSVNSPYMTSQYNHFGRKVRISADGRTVAVAGGGHENFTAYMRVYECIEGAWVLKADLAGNLNPVRQLADMAMSADGNVIALSGTAELNGTQDRGRISIFRRSGPGGQHVLTQVVTPTTSSFWYGEAITLNSDGTVLAAAGRSNIGIWIRATPAVSFTNALSTTLPGGSRHVVRMSRDGGFIYTIAANGPDAATLNVYKAGP